jgi:hypothetical protein
MNCSYSYLCVVNRLLILHVSAHSSCMNNLITQCSRLIAAAIVSRYFDFAKRHYDTIAAVSVFVLSTIVLHTKCFVVL